MQCFGSVLVRLTEPLGSAEPPNLTEPLSSAEPEPVPERFGLPLIIYQTKLPLCEAVFGNVRRRKTAFLNREQTYFYYRKSTNKRNDTPVHLHLGR